MKRRVMSLPLPISRSKPGVKAGVRQGQGCLHPLDECTGAMKFRLPLLVLGLLAALPALAQPPLTVTTTKKSALAIGNGSFALVKGTKLEVIAREGDTLIVKYRASQGKIPVADTDLPADAAVPGPAATAPATPVPAAQPAKPVVGPPAAKPVPPPALTTNPAGKQPTTNYGKAVQKAKQATEAHKSSHVDPTKDIMDDEPKK